MKKSGWISWIIIVIIIAFAFYIINKPSSIGVSEATAKCFAKNSVLYVKLGCVACENQKTIIGENYKYLDIVDCAFDMNRCIDSEITATPTWLIKDQKYIGVKNIETLKQLTGCK
ncbi:MAG: hypothetical protein Q7R52_04195 [archaeon]|nr:hypothetical protein [archaeon]